MVAAGPTVQVFRTPTHWLAEFSAMASPCQLLLDGADRQTAKALSRIAAEETIRIERKFSRYRDDNIIHRINTAAGEPIDVDAETALLLDFANICYQLSDGMFDVTSGKFREVWQFDGSDRLPDASAVSALLENVGWHNVAWHPPQLRLKPGMEIDLGGIGKEYAVDRCYELLLEETDLPFLLNFGGDLRVSGVHRNGEPWHVGVENPNMQQVASTAIRLYRGAIATSGDSRRFLLKHGKRYSHILNPKTGWPVTDAPRSVTVAAPTATEAGMLATFASLQGQNAEAFLEVQQAQYWILR